MTKLIPPAWMGLRRPPLFVLHLNKRLVLRKMWLRKKMKTDTLPPQAFQGCQNDSRRLCLMENPQMENLGAWRCPAPGDWGDRIDDATWPGLLTYGKPFRFAAKRRNIFRD